MAIGKIFTVIRQMFGGEVKASDATSGQVLTKQSDGTWAGVTVSAGSADLIMSSQSVQFAKGADVASADPLVVPTDGNYFKVTGTTAFTRITSTGWQAGSIIMLEFAGAVQVSHGFATSGANAGIRLGPDEDLLTLAGDTVTFAYNGTNWVEVARGTLQSNTIIINNGSALALAGSTVAKGVTLFAASADYTLKLLRGDFSTGGVNLELDTTTGTKIGTGTNQKLGFYNATPIVQGSAVTDPAGGATIDAEARTAIIAINDRLQALGLIA